jgi:hypothetical protein
MPGNGTKKATSSLVQNRTAASGGSCGGNKKPGLPPSVGVSMWALNHLSREHPNYYPGDPAWPCPKSWKQTRNHGVQRSTMIY